MTIAVGWDAAFAQAPSSAASNKPETTMSPNALLTPRQLSIGPIAAATAVGDMPVLVDALHRGFDAGLSVSDAREVLVQLYAYAGFPRSLNALTELMNVVEKRRRSGKNDDPGRDSGAVPAGQALLQLGTANQTRLSGSPVRGPLFEFAPAIDQYLKAHLFGDIFGRDNIDWQSRELATVAALAAMTGVEPQLLSHVRISMNIGLTAAQLGAFADSLAAQGHVDASGRLDSALLKHSHIPKS